MEPQQTIESINFNTHWHSYFVYTKQYRISSIRLNTNKSIQHRLVMCNTYSTLTFTSKHTWHPRLSFLFVTCHVSINQEILKHNFCCGVDDVDRKSWSSSLDDEDLPFDLFKSPLMRKRLWNFSLLFWSFILSKVNNKDVQWLRHCNIQTDALIFVLSVHWTVKSRKSSPCCAQSIFHVSSTELLLHFMYFKKNLVKSWISEDLLKIYNITPLSVFVGLLCPTIVYTNNVSYNIL